MNKSETSFPSLRSALSGPVNDWVNLMILGIAITISFNLFSSFSFFLRSAFLYEGLQSLQNIYFKHEKLLFI